MKKIIILYLLILNFTFHTSLAQNLIKPLIKPGMEMKVDQKYFSSSGKYYLIFQNDGNVVIYNAEGNFIWGSYNNKQAPLFGKKAMMQPDGSFVIYSGDNRFMWAIQTDVAGASVSINNKGEFVIIDPHGEEVWNGNQENEEEEEEREEEESDEENTDEEENVIEEPKEEPNKPIIHTDKGNIPFTKSVKNTLQNRGAELEVLTTYSEQPQILAEYQNNQLMIAWQNHADKHGVNLSAYKMNGANFSKQWMKTLPESIDCLSGFTSDGTNYYCLTTKNEDMSKVQGWVRRDNIMKLVKINPNGEKIWAKDLNQDDSYTGEKQPIYAPMTAGTADITYGAGKIGIMYSSNSDYDESISTRHQSGMRLSVNSSDGSPAAKGQAYSWKHSFDQRILFDGKDFVCMDLPDAGWYLSGPGLELVKINNSDNSHNAGALGWYAYVRNGDNNFSSINMGDLDVGANGYVINFVAQKDGKLTKDQDSRNVAFLHVVKDFEKLPNNSLASDGWKPNKNIYVTKYLVDTRKKNPKASDDIRFKTTAQTAGEVQSTGVVWLTNYSVSEGITASRPKLFKYNDNAFLVMYEEWGMEKSSYWDGFITKDKYKTTKSLIVDEYGNIVKPVKDLGKLPLRYRDQLFGIEGNAAWVYFDDVKSKFILSIIDANLNIQTQELDF